MQLNFIQSNWLRHYPFRAGNGDFDLYNNILPTDLIVALRITCAASDLEVYISKVITNNGVVSITFSGASGPLGFANGTIGMSNQSLLIYNQNQGVIGNVVVGNVDSTQGKKTFTFDNSNGLVEPSTVMVVDAPGVTSLDIKGVKLVGNVKITSTTVSITTGGSVNLNVLRPVDIQSRNDISASRLTCGNPVVGGINTVTPDEHGNINIYAITPVTVAASGNNVTLDSPSTPLTTICKTLNLAPVDSTQTSHQTISAITTPEWAGWPQFE